MHVVCEPGRHRVEHQRGHGVVVPRVRDVARTRLSVSAVVPRQARTRRRPLVAASPTLLNTAPSTRFMGEMIQLAVRIAS